MISVLVAVYVACELTGTLLNTETFFNLVVRRNPCHLSYEYEVATNTLTISSPQRAVASGVPVKPGEQAFYYWFGEKYFYFDDQPVAVVYVAGKT